MTYTACSKGNVLSIIGLSWPAATNLAISFMQRPSGAQKTWWILGLKPVMLQNSLQITRFTRSLWLLAWLLIMHVQQLAWSKPSHQNKSAWCIAMMPMLQQANNIDHRIRQHTCHFVLSFCCLVVVNARHVDTVSNNCRQVHLQTMPDQAGDLGHRQHNALSTQWPKDQHQSHHTLEQFDSYI